MSTHIFSLTSTLTSLNFTRSLDHQALYIDHNSCECELEEPVVVVGDYSYRYMYIECYSDRLHNS